MEKSFSVESVEVFGEAGSGKFEALVGVFGNIDAVKDVVMPGAFAKAIADSDPPPVVWAHHWNIPPIGNTIDWSETPKGLAIKGELFVGDDDKHQYADMVYAAMKSREGRKPALREFSFSYGLPDDGEVKATRDVNGKTVTVQELHSIFPVYEVGPCLKGCNSATELLGAPKSLGPKEVALLRRIEAVALARAKELQELIEELEAGVPAEEAIRRSQYREILLATPDH